MNWIGYVEMPVSKIKLPSEIAQRMKEPRVVALAESTDDLGGDFMHAPTVNADVTPPELVAGRDRMAATLLRKRKKVWVHVGKNWSPLDLIKAEIRENLHRRHDDKAALTKQLVDKAEALVVGRTSQNSGAKPEGRPKTDRTKAREMVAEASGQPVATVKKADQRAQARDEGAAGNRDVGPAAPPPPPIETNGHPMPAIVAAGIGPITAAFDKADRLLRQAQAALGELELSSYSPGMRERLKQMVHDDAAAVRAERPYALCPYCIGKLAPDQLQGDSGPKCGVCQEQRYVNRSTFEAAPGKKLHGAEAIRAARAEDRPAKKQKRIGFIVDGRELTAEEVEAMSDGAAT